VSEACNNGESFSTVTNIVQNREDKKKSYEREPTKLKLLIINPEILARAIERGWKICSHLLVYFLFVIMIMIHIFKNYIKVNVVQCFSILN